MAYFRQRKRRGSFTISPVKNPSGETVFQLSGTMTDGTRIRQRFRTKEKATGEKQRLEIECLNFNPAATLQHTKLTADQLRNAESAFDRLGDGCLLKAVDFFIQNYSPDVAEKTVFEAFHEFIEIKHSATNLRPRTVNDLRSRNGKLAEEFGERIIHTIQTKEIRSLLSGKEQNQINQLRAMGTFFRWCIKRRYCVLNPAAEIERPKIDQAHPEILTIKQVVRLLNLSHGGPLGNYFTLGFFCGLRPNELERLTWDHVKLSRRVIHVSGDIAKVRKLRTVEVSENAVQWLDVKKPIFPANWRRLFDSVRKSARMHKNWIQDGIRHTAISYHFAKHHNEGMTASWAGNSPDIVHREYKGLVDPEDVETFWNITPCASSSKIVSV
ncbi:tyrosine-type recombinase/integrase [bacterium]|nr:tyrosine-type recombinase/integrase [bacterium]